MVKPDQLQLVNLISRKGNTGGQTSSVSTQWATAPAGMYTLEVPSGIGVCRVQEANTVCSNLK